MLPITVLSLIAVYLSHMTRGEDFCDKKLVRQAWERCNKAYQPNDEDVDVTDMCNNVECFIQCYQDALGDCKDSDIFLDQIVDFDVEKWGVYYRAACSNRTMVLQLSGEENICPSNQTCTIQTFSSSADSNLLDLYKAGKYQEYRELICSTFAKGRECISVDQTENCSAASASYYADVLKIGSSLSICDNTDIKHLYMKYGGTGQCIDPKVDSTCFRSKVRSRISKCRPLTSDAESFVRCQNLECDLKCYEEAVGDCYMKGENLLLDPTVVKVSNRAACDNQEVISKALQECVMSNQSCLSLYFSTLSNADDLIEHEKYMEYKQTVCSAASKYRMCEEYVATGNCTDEMVSLLHSLKEVSYSYAGCGSQDHAYFSQYGDDIYCDTSGSRKSVTSITIISLLMFVFVVLRI